MSRKTLSLDGALYEYLVQVSVREDDVLRRLREETARMPQANMQIAPEQGQFLALLVKVLGASRCLEIGTFTGYSTLWMARALNSDGFIIACDINAEWTSVAQRYWREAGVAERIELRLGEASATLHEMLSRGERAVFDFAFIDADKTGYLDYYEQSLALLRPGGMIAIDNTLWSGAVADPHDSETDTLALRALNEYLLRDPRVDISLVPIGDGLSLARKREP